MILCISWAASIQSVAKPHRATRLRKEVEARLGPRDAFISAMDAPERRNAAWLGGSIVASLPEFVQNNFVSKAEYAEDGAAAVKRRCA